MFLVAPGTDGFIPDEGRGSLPNTSRPGGEGFQPGLKDGFSDPEKLFPAPTSGLQ